jgi:glycosyltransferase involved in cell wall biosynthesis
VTHFGFLSSYPPTRCGLATFTESLATAMIRQGEPSGSIVRALDELELRAPVVVGSRSTVVAHLVAGDPLSRSSGIRAMDATDVVIVQHEYGIYGGPDGDEIIEVLRRVATPTIVVLHTVLPAPSEHQREVLIAVCDLAGAIVVMTENALDTLASVYLVDPAKVRVIPHGVAEWRASTRPSGSARKQILTWGLISPGKGIEWGIRAIAELRERGIDANYVVAGQTHPKVLAHAGESYREMLAELVASLGVGDLVTLDDRYRDTGQLGDLVSTADVVLLPYDSRDQVTSGVLVEAIAAGIPVVATGFPHAVELLSGGAGAVAKHEDPSAMADALQVILTADAVAERMHRAALVGARHTSWASVGREYRAIAELLVAARAA